MIIGELPEQAGLPGRTAPSSEENKIGLTFRDLSEQTKDQLGIDAGVEVTGVNGLAAEAGLRPRDIILRMQTRAVADAQALNEIIENIEPGSIVPILVMRQQQRIFITLKVPERIDSMAGAIAILTLLSAGLCHKLAKDRRRRSAFWVTMARSLAHWPWWRC